MRQLLLPLRLQICSPSPIRFTVRDLRMSLLIFLPLAVSSGAPAFSPPLQNYAEIKVEVFIPEADLIEAAQRCLQQEKEKNQIDALLILQTDIQLIEIESNVREITKFGNLFPYADVRWYLIHRGQQNLSIKKPFLCSRVVRLDSSKADSFFHYYRLKGIESEIKTPMVSIPGDAAAIDSFCISATEITNAQFCAFLNDSAASKEVIAKWIDWENEFSRIKKENDEFVSRAGFANDPVVLVSAYGARDFCAWLSAKEKRRYRLPTPEEWEWAAQGANRRRNGMSFPLRGNFSGSDGRIDKWPKLAPVDELPADTLGLKGMWGNAWEWCEISPGKETPQEIENGSANSRPIQGGSWLFSAAQIQAASQAQVSSDFRSFAIGFRVVKPCRNYE